MKILIIGCGGIGSWFCHFLAFGIRNSFIDCDATVADGDKVEDKNLLYSNFGLFDVEKNKAEVMARNYHYNFIPHEIKDAQELKKFNVVILATDDGKSRKMVFESGVDWIDMRAKGRAFGVFIKGCRGIEELVGNLDIESGRESCQDDYRLKDRIIDSANVIAASVGYQMFLNYLRNEAGTKEFRGYI